MAINFSGNNNPEQIYFNKQSQEVYALKYNNQWVWAKPFYWSSAPTGGPLATKTATNTQHNTITSDEIFPIYSQVAWTYDYQDSIGVQGYFTVPRGISSNENVIRFSFIKPTSNNPGDADSYTKKFINTGSISEWVWTKNGKSETIVRIQKDSANAFNINLSEWTDLEYYEEGRRMYGYILKLQVSNYNGLLSTKTGTLHIPIMLGKSRTSATAYRNIISTFSFIWNTIWMIGSKEEKTDYWKFVDNSGKTYHAVLGSNDENYLYYSTQENAALTGRFYFYFEKKLYGNAQNAYFTRTSTYEPTATTGTISPGETVYWGDVLNYYVAGSKKLTYTVENSDSGVLNWNQYFLELPDFRMVSAGSYYRDYTLNYKAMLSASITACFYTSDHQSYKTKTYSSGGFLDSIKVGCGISDIDGYPNFAYWTGTISQTIGGYSKTQNISLDIRPSSVAAPTTSLVTEVTHTGGVYGTSDVYSYKLYISTSYSNIPCKIRYRMHHRNGSIGNWTTTTWKNSPGTSYWYHESETESGMEYEVYYYYLGAKSGTSTGSGGQLSQDTGGEGGGGGDQEETETTRA